MSRALVFTIGVLFVLLGNSCSQSDDFLIDNDRAGLFHKTMTAEEAWQVAQKNYTVKKSAISLEGDDYLAYEVYSGSELLLKLQPACEGDCQLSRIWVYSDRFKTNNGVGVGSTVSDLSEKYTFDYLESEGFAICIFVKELDVCFVPEPLTYEWFTSGAKFEEIPRDTKITLIFP